MVRRDRFLVTTTDTSEPLAGRDTKLRFKKIKLDVSSPFRDLWSQWKQTRWLLFKYGIDGVARVCRFLADSHVSCLSHVASSECAAIQALVLQAVSSLWRLRVLIPSLCNVLCSRGVLIKRLKMSCAWRRRTDAVLCVLWSYRSRPHRLRHNLCTVFSISIGECSFYFTMLIPRQTGFRRTLD